MLARRSLETILGSPGHLKVLRVLFQLPEGVTLSGRDIGRRAGLAHHRASAILEELSDVGIVLTQRAPRLALHGLNRDHVAHPPLSQLFEWEASADHLLLDYLSKQLAKVKGVEAAFVYGSVAWGEPDIRSDIDILVLAPHHPEDVNDALERVGEEVRRRFGGRLEPQVVQMGQAQFARAARSGKRLWKQILNEGVQLVGTAGSRG